MTLGTGIFLSTTLLVVFGLYAITKDRWRWKRIVGWIVGPVVAAFAAFMAWDTYNDWASDQPEKVLTLWGLKIGMPEDEVLFLKGAPYEICTWPVEKAPKYLTYQGQKGEALKIVSLDSASRVIRVDVLWGDWPSDAPTLEGVSRLATREDLIAKFGEPDVVQKGESEPVSDREELQALRRLAELEARSVAGSSTAPDAERKSSVEMTIEQQRALAMAKARQRAAAAADPSWVMTFNRWGFEVTMRQNKLTDWALVAPLDELRRELAPIKGAKMDCQRKGKNLLPWEKYGKPQS